MFFRNWLRTISKSIIYRLLEPIPTISRVSSLYNTIASWVKPEIMQFCKFHINCILSISRQPPSCLARTSRSPRLRSRPSTASGSPWPPATCAPWRRCALTSSTEPRNRSSVLRWDSNELVVFINPYNYIKLNCCLLVWLRL